MDRREHSQLRYLLLEREKELDALFQLASLYSQPSEDSASVLARTLRVLKHSMQDAEGIQIEISADGSTAAFPAGSSQAELYHAHRSYSSDKELRISVKCFCSSASVTQDEILDHEKRLIDSTADLLVHALQRQEIEEELRRKTQALEEQRKKLEEKNIALNEILSQIEQEKQKLLNHARTQISTFILPSLIRLKHNTGMNEEGRKQLEQLEQSLQDIFSGKDSRMLQLAEVLTPREIEISVLIRNGLSTKDISSFLHIAEATVERHRNTIRKKLNLRGSQKNLVSYLRSYD